MNTKIAWCIINLGTNNITEAFSGGYPTGLPAIFKTRKIARTYRINWHGIEAHKVAVRKIKIVECNP